jgi:hypothetical protein
MHSKVSTLYCVGRTWVSKQLKPKYGLTLEEQNGNIHPLFSWCFVNA